MESYNEKLKQELQEIKEEGERRVQERQQKLEHMELMFHRKIEYLHSKFHQLNNTIEVNNTRNHLNSLNDFIGHMELVITSLQSIHVHLPTSNKHTINYHLEEFKDAMRNLTSKERCFHIQLLNSSSHQVAVHVVLMDFTKDFQSISSALPNYANHSKRKPIKANGLESHITLLQGFRERGMQILHQFSNFDVP